MNGKRHVYLDMKTRAEALDILLETLSGRPLVGTEEVATPHAVGRVLAEPVYAVLSSPAFHAAAMDGIAVRARDTYGATEAAPRQLSAGDRAVFVNTGHRLPEGMDAVIMIENVHRVDEGVLEIRKAAYPWQHVRKVGEDIVATELLFSQNRYVDPPGMAAMLTAGVRKVRVRARPRVLIVPTGDELVPWDAVEPEDIQPGQVLETNSEMMGKLVEQTGGEWTRTHIVPDDFSTIRDEVARAAEQDVHLVLVLAGSSAGSEDHTANVIAELGRVLVHGVTVMPGKPVVLGEISGTPVVGVPGYPVSAIVAFDEFVRPLLGRMLGKWPLVEDRPRAMVEASRKIPSRLGIEDLVRVRLGRVGKRIVATPLPRAAGSITSFTEADGIIRIPNQSEGVGPGEPVEAELLTARAAIDNTIVVVGSHDNTLDCLADELKAGHHTATLSSSHVGSTGGLLAVKRAACHVAGTHLLDTSDGTYNISYIKRMLRDVPVRLVHLVMRDQGFMVPKGNPGGIRGVEDLSRADVVFINRQAGSGTRILLDYKLEQAGIEPDAIAGYENEEFTHMNVAASVMSGAADCGLGIMAAARALGLDFVPVVTEQYDLVIPVEYFDTGPIQAMLETIRSPGFIERVNALGGYHTERTGEILM
ncbi:MAG: molybdopterin biosynthesis protein [Desulfatibacillaceae bacterium]